jgi:hypothetical protein
MNGANTVVDMAEGIAMRINSKDFSVLPGEKVELEKWPTSVKPIRGGVRGLPERDEHP